VDMSVANQVKDEDNPLTLGADKHISVPISSLISIVVATSVATILYFQVTSRLDKLEYDRDLIAIEVEENDSWIDDFQPPKAVQETVLRVRELERELLKVQFELEQLKGH